MDTHSALSKAVAASGSQKKLACSIGVSHQTVWAWISRGSVPAERCPAIERATNGAVTCEDLRPDVDWAYLRGTEKKDAVSGAEPAPHPPECGTDDPRQCERRDGDRRRDDNEPPHILPEKRDTHKRKVT